ncbi:MAG: 50S ribosomal protein L17 [Deltaproteobacteria bacterium]|nr:50S ribosomal protein L17 [Deltaproteobacteria bacterium]
MRHRKQGRRLSRKAPHRHAMWSNMVASLVTYERIQTTDAKAKELKRIAEPVITWGTKVADIIDKAPEKLDAEEKAAIVHAYRMARRVLKQREALDKLFRELGPRFRGRPGGYTRVLKYRVRAGDAAPMSIVELLPGDGKSEKPVKTVDDEGKAAKKPAKAKKDAAASGSDAPAKAPKAKKKKDTEAAAE